MRKFLFLILLTSISFAFLDHTISIYPKEGGSAHIKETTTLLFTDPQQLNLFKGVLNMEGPKIVDLKQFSPVIGYHFTGDISNTRVSSYLHANRGIVVVAYDVKNAFSVVRAKIRKKIFTFNKDLLVYAEENKTTIPDKVRIQFILPQDAKLLDAAPEYLIDNNSIIFKGPQTSTDFILKFEEKIPISEDLKSQWYTFVSSTSLYTHNTAFILTVYTLIVFLILGKVKNSP